MAAIIIAWVLTIGAIIGLALTWNAPRQHRSYETPMWWVWGSTSWRGYRRSQLPLALFLASGAIALTVPHPSGAVVALLGLATALIAMLSIVLFNRPKIIVPPAARNEDGVLLARRRRGTHGRE
jgi:hypothetical protein